MRPLEPDVRGVETTAWQRFFANKRFYRRPIGGVFGRDTSEATAACQKSSRLQPSGAADRATLDRARRDGFVPASEDRRLHYRRKNGNVVISARAREVLKGIAEECYLETDKELIIASGMRTPHRQASAMYDNLHNHRSARYANQEAF